MKYDEPIRYPDTSSPEQMTRRGWLLVVLGFCVPGLPQLVTGNKRLGRFAVRCTVLLWVLTVAALLTLWLAPELIYSLVTLSWLVLIVQIVLGFYAVLWCVCMLNTIRLLKIQYVKRSVRAAMATVALVALVFSSGTAAYAAYLLNSQRTLLDSVFTLGPAADPIDGRYNILLLGVDAGEDREGIRPDSISVVSIDAETGAATMIGIPRDLRRLPIPESSPLREVYPKGHCGDCKANGLYNPTEAFHPHLFPDAIANGSTPGVEATKDAVEGATGIQIQYYVMVDMVGFAKLIDALGGVKINAPKRVALVPKDAVGTPKDWVEVGEHTLNGADALWYARSRYQSTDWERMERQRQLELAVLEQFTPANVMSKFSDIAGASSELIRTDIPQSMLPHFVNLATKTRTQPVQSIDLSPPLVPNQDKPDYNFIRQHINETLYPPAPAAPAG